MARWFIYMGDRLLPFPGILVRSDFCAASRRKRHMPGTLEPSCARGIRDRLMKTMGEFATFAAGCFWGVELEFGKLPGVLGTKVGYTGGDKNNPSYYEVCDGDTGHAEAVQSEFDPSVVSFERLARGFFDLHDPTTLNRQGQDLGDQYR